MSHTRAVAHIYVRGYSCAGDGLTSKYMQSSAENDYDNTSTRPSFLHSVTITTALAAAATTSKEQLLCHKNHDKYLCWRRRPTSINIIQAFVSCPLQAKCVCASLSECVPWANKLFCSAFGWLVRQPRSQQQTYFNLRTFLFIVVVWLLCWWIFLRARDISIHHSTASGRVCFDFQRPVSKHSVLGTKVEERKCSIDKRDSIVFLWHRERSPAKDKENIVRAQSANERYIFNQK